MKPVPTPEQAEVILAQSQDLVVSASAGVGKTFVLVERYLRLVTEADLSPTAILAITFTRKAAAEMKARIVARLKEEGLREQARQAETGPIQTIHSFCETLLRERALVAGLDPEFEVLEDEVNGMLDVAARRALAADPVEAPNVPDLLRAVALIPGRQDADQMLLSKIGDTVRRLRGTGVSLEDYRERATRVESLLAGAEELLLDRLDPETRIRIMNGEGSFVERWATATERSRNSRMVTPKTHEALEASLPPVAGFGQAIALTWEHFELALAQRRGLDFVSLEARAVQLAESGRLGPIPYRAVLVDEAQDLNPIQYRLLEQLGVDQQMLVGDVKQSIYGFRQAAPHLFRERMRSTDTLRLSQNRRSTDGILRFVDAVGSNHLEDYDAIAPHRPLDLDAASQEDFAGVEIWETNPESWSIETADKICQLIAEGIPAHDIAVLTRRREPCVELLRELNQRGVMGRILGGSSRYYARMEIRDLANTLRAATDPTDAFALLAVLHSPVVGLSVDAIVLLSQVESVWEALPGFEFPSEDDRRRVQAFLDWFAPFSRIADRLTAWEALAQVLALSPYLVEVATRPDRAQRLANIRKLQQIAVQHPEMGPSEFAEFVREIQSLSHEEGDAPARDEGDFVTLMTVHKSKGLEFPVVVLPDTNGALGSIPAGAVLLEAERGLAAFLGLSRPLVDLLKQRQLLREEAEAHRLIYVALTRAKHRLCLGIYRPKGQRTVSEVLRKTFERVGETGVVRRQNPV